MILGITVLSVVILLIMITCIKINPFVSLLSVSVFLGLATGMPLEKVVDSIQSGMGNTLGLIAIVLGLGTMLGKMLEESGGAERIARTLVHALGVKKVHWAMMFVALIVGIPVFFQVGFVLLIPIVFTIAKDTGISLLKIGLPLAAGLSVMHGLVPPHPAVMATVNICNADVGKTIVLSIIVGLPLAIISGPVFANYISDKMPHFTVPTVFANQIKDNLPEDKLPGFGITLLTIIMPVLLMMLGTFADLMIPKGTLYFSIFKFIGSPFMALLLALLFSFFSLGLNQNFSLMQISRSCDQSLPSMAGILMVIGAGGAFNKILIDCGAGLEIAEVALTMKLSPVVLAWCVAAAIRVATGSPTVSMMTAAGIVEPLIGRQSAIAPEIIVLALGSGALVLSHVNCAGFWIVKEYLGMSIIETLKTWTVLVTITGIGGLLLTLLLSKFI